MKDIREKALAHYLDLATHPDERWKEAWRREVWRRVQELSKDTSGLFTDFDKEFLKALDERKAKSISGV